MTDAAFCGQCGSRLAANGRFCQRCGPPQPHDAFQPVDLADDRWPIWKVTLIIIGVIVIIAVPTAFMLASTNAPASERAINPEDQLIARAEADIRKSLKDPSSAQFDNMIPTVEADCVIGKVNARNGFGWFTGFQQFVWERGHLMFEEGLGDQAFLKAFSRCMRAGVKPVNGT